MANAFPGEPELEIHSADADEGISFNVIVGLFKRHQLLVSLSALVAAGLIVAIGLSRGRTYSSQATFILSTSKGSGSVSGLAAQFGVAIPVSDAAESPQFYVDLVHSNQVLEPVANSTYTLRVGDTTISGGLAKILRIDDDRPALKRDKVLKALGKRVSAYADPKTGVVTVSVSAPYPVLAQQLAARLLDRLNVFNLQGRQSRASAERKFTEARLIEAREELHAAENQLEQFLETNREYRLSPKLTLEQDRLARAVGMRQQLYTAIAQSYEQAKLEEVRDLPVITTISEPEIPVVPDHRGLLRKGLFG